jgi:hypothetical protein
MLDSGLENVKPKAAMLAGVGRIDEASKSSLYLPILPVAWLRLT